MSYQCGTRSRHLAIVAQGECSMDKVIPLPVGTENQGGNGDAAPAMLPFPERRRLGRRREDRIFGVLVSVVIPAMNEAENLPHVLPRIPKAVHEVLLVDGNSTDGTVEIARAILPEIR